jgi:hypothetical protein
VTTTSTAKYLQQNVKALLATYASAMDPSGLAWFLTERFNVHSLLLMGYIHPYCTEPLRIVSSSKWTVKWTITSKKARGKIFSSLHRIIGISIFSFCKTTSEFCNIVAEKSFLVLQ